MNSFLFLTVALSVACWGVWGFPQVRHEENPEKLDNVSKFHVDIYSHPKTTFSCEGKQAGEYYADPEAKCAIYFICLENVNGGLSAMSFACPNSTIFNQATRVCSPEDQVFCSLATRFYDSVNGHIDSKGKDVKSLSTSPSAHHSQSWISVQKQRRPSSANMQPVPAQSQTVPEIRMKQAKGNHNSRIPPPPPSLPKVLTNSPPSVRKVPKSMLSIPTATKKPEPRDYEDPAVGEEEMEYENTSSARNQ